MRHRLGFIYFLVCSVVAPVAVADTGQGSLIIKGGMFWLNDTSEELARRSVVLDRTDDVWAVAFESGGTPESFGIEFLRHAHSWEAKNPSDDRPSGKIEQYILSVLLKRRYVARKNVVLFAGAGVGIGIMQNKFTDLALSYPREKEQDTLLAAIQVNTGAEIYFNERTALYSEIKILNTHTGETDAEDAPSRRNKYPDLIGSSAWLGIRFSF